jgi:hypothetical protein
MTIGFARDIRPYFTACYRAHMLKFGTDLDLWSDTNVKDQFDAIYAIVQAEEMPPAAPAPSPCPEGGWDSLTREQFLKDFQAWKDGGFKP